MTRPALYLLATFALLSWTAQAGAEDDPAAVAREEKADVVAPFVSKLGLTWPFAIDPDRSVFKRYAEAYIPRNVVIDREGTVVFESQGYDDASFAALLAVLEAQLSR
jgi:hypothetical protein